MRMRNLLWLVLVRVRSLLIRSGLLRLRIGPLDVNAVLFSLGFRLAPPFKHAITVTLTTGQTLFVPAGHSAGRVYATNSYERDVTSLFLSLVKPGMTVIDLGAHIGYYSLLASSLAGPAGTVYAFEPDPRYYSVLTQNLEANGCVNVRTVAEAVSRECGETFMWSEAGAGGSNLFARTGAFPNTRIRVRVTTLDDFLARAGWPAVDLIKMDIEGAEAAALEGMTELSRRNTSLRLIVEVLPRGLAAAGTSVGGLFAQLERLGFTRFSVIEAGLRQIAACDLAWLQKHTEFREANLLCEKC